MDRKRKVIACEIKEFDDETRSFLAVASTEDLDRDNDRIMSDGWDLDNFLKNPVIPWSHRYGDPPVAQATEVYVEDGKLMFRPKFATKEQYDFADTIYRLYKGGFLRSFSVGFMPKRFEVVDRDEKAQGKGRGYDFLEQELWEISAVTVPANPNALVAAKQKGVISEEEANALNANAVEVAKALNANAVPAHVKDALDDYVEQNRERLQVLADEGNILAGIFLDLDSLEPSSEEMEQIMGAIDDLGSLFEAPNTLGGFEGPATGGENEPYSEHLKRLDDILEGINALTEAVSGLVERMDNTDENLEDDNPNRAEPRTATTPKPETLTLDESQAGELTQALTDGLERRIAGIVSDRLKYHLGKVD